ncbi:hypothetical protein N7519_001531 [Penicillium mononematosum]|uniref:uncharacterized protein n=1 Tax=Penicillium mononematosum TaxID=268346 RepID=UPI002547B48D|nr:uncharacterized protein N7519_001531 [Penicillium mononematosum]KAJ6191510.1 hypothetical protein N7519_001531 [Penicillium mononematosum]
MEMLRPEMEAARESEAEIWWHPSMDGHLALDNEQLELLTQLRMAHTWRAHARRSIIQQARIIRTRAYEVRMQYEADGQPPRAQMLRGLRRWLQALVGSMQMLRSEEEAARELETEIWTNIQ